MNSPTIVAYLEQWPWFRGCSAKLRSLVLETTTDLLVEPGQFVARVGSPPTHWYGAIRGFFQMYVLTSGGVETTLYCLREGEWGGDGSLLKKERLQYDLRALTAGRLCLVPATTFDTLRTDSIAFSNFLCEILNARMGEFVGMLAATRLGSPELQVARGLLMLVDRDAARVVHLPISQHELALISGLSRQRVNAAVGLFHRLSIIRGEARNRSLDVDVPRLNDYLRTVARGDGSKMPIP